MSSIWMVVWPQVTPTSALICCHFIAHSNDISKCWIIHAGIIQFRSISAIFSPYLWSNLRFSLHLCHFSTYLWQNPRFSLHLCHFSTYLWSNLRFFLHLCFFSACGALELSDKHSGLNNRSGQSNVPLSLFVSRAD